MKPVNPHDVNSNRRRYPIRGGKTKISARCKVSVGSSTSPKAKIASLTSSIPKFKLQLFPIDETTRLGLEKDGFNPYLELTLSSRKRIASVMRHLNTKWSASCIARGEPVLFPFSVSRNLLSCTWTMDDNGTTAEEVYTAIGRPPLFRLRYGWLNSESKVSQSSDLHLQNDLNCNALECNVASCSERKEYIPDELIPSSIVGSIQETYINNGSVESLSNVATINNDRVRSSSNVAATMQENMSDDQMEPPPFSAAGECQINSDQESLSAVVACIEHMIDDQHESCNLPLPVSSSTREERTHNDHRNPLSVFNTANCEGKAFCIQGEQHQICGSSHEAGVGTNVAMWDENTTNVRIGGLFSEETIKQLRNVDTKADGNGREVKLSELVSDSFDAFIAKYSQPPASLVPNSSLLDAEDTCHAFSFQTSSSNRNVYGESRSEQNSLVSQYNIDDSSLGLSAIKWTDSLGAFDFGFSSRKAYGEDSVSIGRIIS